MRSEHDSHIVLATIVPLAACLVFFIVWQSNGGGAISLPLLPIPSFTLPALPTITLPAIHVPMPLPVRHLVRTISRNPLAIAAAVLGGTIAGGRYHSRVYPRDLPVASHTNRGVADRRVLRDNGARLPRAAGLQT